MSNLNNNTTQLEALLAKVNALPEAGSGGLDTSDATATSGDILSGKTAYVDGEKITGMIATVSQATPTITINSATGLITATATQTAGYVTAGSKSATKQLAFQAAKTITPKATSQTAVPSGYYTGGSVTVAGDSNLIAGNIKSGVSIFGVSGTYVGSGGGEATEYSEAEDSILTRTISGTYTNDRVTVIGSYAFARCINLNSVSFPAVTGIGSYAFSSCTSLTTANFPVCTSIGSYAFSSCTSLTSISFPVCTSIGSYAFASCTSLTTANFPACQYIKNFAFQTCRGLTSISFPVCTSIGSYAFASCTSLTTANFPACASIGSYAFRQCSKLTLASFPACHNIGEQAFSSCTSLTTANFPVCTSIGGNAFGGCAGLTSISFPACASISSYAFRQCSKLTLASFPACHNIGEQAFSNCTSLSQIYLTASAVCTLSNSNAFYNAGIGSTKGSIFVPSSLVTSYQSATNWTYFSNRIFGV